MTAESGFAAKPENQSPEEEQAWQRGYDLARPAAGLKTPFHQELEEAMGGANIVQASPIARADLEEEIEALPDEKTRAAMWAGWYAGCSTLATKANET